MKKLSLLVIIAAAAILVGCGGKDDKGKGGTKGGESAALPADLVVAELAGEAVPPIKARPTVKVGDEVLLSGNIAGREVPMVDGRAMFTLVGEELAMCGEECSMKCPTYWDLCCKAADVIMKHAVTIQVVGPDGKPIKASLKDYKGIKYGSKILVSGKVAQVDENTFVVNATKIALKKEQFKPPKG